MIQLLKLKSIYFIFYTFIVITLLSNNKIQADQQIKIIADQIRTSENGDFIEAKGNAVAINEFDERLSTDKMTYNKSSKEINATGNVIFNDLEKNTFFMDRIVSKNDMEYLEGREVKARLKDDSRIVGSNITRSDGISILQNAEYTPCKEEEYLIKNCPGWKLKSSKIFHDTKTKTIHYDHARIHLFNLPVIYLPYFSHPDPSVNKRSGLLMPTIETDNQLGDIFSIPIFYNIANNQDITFTPTYQSNSNNFYTINYRNLNNSGYFNIDASINDNDDKKGTKNHLFFEGDINNPFGSLEAFLQTSNNDTYMRKNKINKFTVLRSGIDFERSTDNDYLSLQAIGYKHLTVQNAEQWEYVYPKVTYNINNIDNNLIDGSISLNNDLLIKSFQDDKTSLLSSQINWRNNTIDKKFGLAANNIANLRIVSVSVDNKNSPDSDNIRFYPQLSSKITYPLMKSTDNTNQTLSPIIMPIITPYNNYTSAQSITSSNIFSENRASSITEWESGPRINYGVEWFMDTNNGQNIKVTIGQNYRINKNDNDNTKELSDYYLSSSLSINSDNYMNNSLVIDRNDIDIKTINMSTYNKFFDMKIAMDYDYSSGKYTAPNEQLAIGAEYNFEENFFFKFTGSKNLDTNKNIGYQYGLLYENDCLGIDFNYFRDLTKDRDIAESDGYSLTIVLKPFGSTKNYGKNKVFGPKI